MAETDTFLDDTLGADLMRVAARLNRWATYHGRWAVPAAQARLLAQVDELGAARISDLARADHCSQPGMTAQVHRLEKAGLLTRAPDPEDARAALISLTDAGRVVLNEVRAARAAAVAPLVGALSDDERRRLRGAVTTFEALLDRAASLPQDH